MNNVERNEYPKKRESTKRSGGGDFNRFLRSARVYLYVRVCTCVRVHVRMGECGSVCGYAVLYLGVRNVEQSWLFFSRFVNVHSRFAPPNLFFSFSTMGLPQIVVCRILASSDGAA